MKGAPSPRPRPKRPVLLKDEERYRLLHGPYEAPLVKRGFLVDAVRGKVRFGKTLNEAFENFLTYRLFNVLKSRIFAKQNRFFGSVILL